MTYIFKTKPRELSFSNVDLNDKDWFQFSFLNGIFDDF